MFVPAALAATARGVHGIRDYLRDDVVGTLKQLKAEIQCNSNVNVVVNSLRIRPREMTLEALEDLVGSFWRHCVSSLWLFFQCTLAECVCGYSCRDNVHRWDL